MDSSLRFLLKFGEKDHIEEFAEYSVASEPFNPLQRAIHSER